MVIPMESIHNKQSIFEKEGVSIKAESVKAARVIIDYNGWG